MRPARHQLVRHPDTPCPAIDRIDAELGQDGRGGVRLCYRIAGDAQRIVAAPPASGAQPQRRDELWRHTCCELFVHDDAGAGYREYNFAPCGDWAAYRFGAYRAGRTSPETARPRIALQRSAAVLTLTATLADLPFDSLYRRRIGIACIVETPAGLSCWALAHPPGRPDFHDVRAFALTFAPEHAEDSIAVDLPQP